MLQIHFRNFTQNYEEKDTENEKTKTACQRSNWSKRNN